MRLSEVIKKNIRTEKHVNKTPQPPRHYIDLPDRRTLLYFVKPVSPAIEQLAEQQDNQDPEFGVLEVGKGTSCVAMPPQWLPQPYCTSPEELCYSDNSPKAMIALITFLRQRCKSKLHEDTRRQELHDVIIDHGN